MLHVEYLGRAVTCQRLLHSFYAEVDLQRDRHSPCQDTPGEPIQHGSQVDEAPRHRNVGDVHRPDLIGPDDGQFSEQIGVDLVTRRRFRGVRLAIERLDAHALHHCGNMQPTDLEAFLDQQAL